MHWVKVLDEAQPVPEFGGMAVNECSGLHHRLIITGSIKVLGADDVTGAI
ncbi:hypothetical protein U8607_21170 [Methylobacterium durans]|nr:hypothetical protein [Methylobacterium durans]MEA1834609.1 hypothetical protein [Methylobacterium durans]